jgi:uncharacterized membrane protein
MFHSDRPKLKIAFTPFDLLIEVLSLALLSYIWIHLFMVYGDLPETVPSHFNAEGKADSFSKKAFLFFIPLLTTGLYLLLFFLSKYPHLHNYTVNITEDNAAKQYRFSVTVLRIVNFLCVLMFAYINFQILLGAQTNQTHLGKGFIITVISASIVLPIAMLLYQKRLNKA